MKSRLYDENIKARGTIYLSSDPTSLIGLQLRDKDLNQKFKLVVKKFLEDNKLKIVSNDASFKSHCGGSKYNKNKKQKLFDIFFKFKNPRTQRIELKPIKKNPQKDSNVHTDERGFKK